jgi:hypothetical protein
MNRILYNDAPPEAVTPSHTILQAQTSPAPDAPLNCKPSGFTVKPLTGEAFHNAKTAVQTVDHPFNQSVGYSFRNLPKPDLIPLASPFPIYRGQMLGVYPIRFLDLIGD